MYCKIGKTIIRIISYFASEINKLENKMKTAKGDTTELSNALAELRSKESLNNAELHKLNATIARTETQND